MLWVNDLTEDIRSSYDPYNEEDTLIASTTSYYDGRVEVTEANREEVLKYFNLIKNKCVAILEIGVCRNNNDSFTHIFLDNKLPNTTYIGIDLEDKSFLNNVNKKIHTIKDNSRNIENIKVKFEMLGIEKFDFIFIDGDHSINGVLNDWEYSNFLNKGGIIGFHDINYHIGPKYFLNALDQSKWNISKTCPEDWGVGFVWKK